MLRVFVAAFLVGAFCAGCSLTDRSGQKKVDRIYQVKSGDSLTSIGQNHGVLPSDIERYNGINDPRSIRPGQKIVIPAVGPIDDDVASNGELNVSRDRAQLRMISLAPVRGYVGNLEFPVEQARYSSRFGWRWRKFHEGMDLAAPEGTPVIAAHDGIVVLASESWGRYGKVVVIKGEGLMTVYGHNSDNKVSKGHKVRRGQIIAKVGATGDASGPHLHFETRILDANKRFSAVNPAVFFPN